MTAPTHHQPHHPFTNGLAVQGDIWQALLDNGLSPEAVTLVMDSNRQSTLSKYMRKLKEFKVWCAANGHDMQLRYEVAFASFLAYVRSKKGLAASTLRFCREILLETAAQQRSQLGSGHYC